MLGIGTLLSSPQHPSKTHAAGTNNNTAERVLDATVFLIVALSTRGLDSMVSVAPSSPVPLAILIVYPSFFFFSHTTTSILHRTIFYLCACSPDIIAHIETCRIAADWLENVGTRGGPRPVGQISLTPGRCHSSCIDIHSTQYLV